MIRDHGPPGRSGRRPGGAWLLDAESADAVDEIVRGTLTSSRFDRQMVSPSSGLLVNARGEGPLRHADLRFLASHWRRAD